METKKFSIKINRPENGNGEKKKSIKRRILSKVGFTLVGGLAGAAIGASGRKPETVQEGTVTEEEVPQEVQDLLNESQQETAQQQTPQSEITEPQPMDNNNTGGNSNAGTTEEPADPKDVAQSIAHEIDPNDIDTENVITVDSYDYAFLPDGTQQQVFIGHTPDGTQYILADLDGDGMYGDIFDINGNYVTEVPGVSESDLAEAIDDSGGYIGGMDEAWEHESETMVSEELTESEEVNEEELDEDLLAQLIDDETEDETSRVIEVDNPEEEESDEEENADEVEDE